MLSFNVSSPGLDELIERVEDWSYRLRDLRPLADAIGVIVADDVYTKALAGEDVNGVPLAPLADATWNWGRVPRGPGEPLAPEEQASRLIAGFELRIENTGPDHLTLIGEWPSLDRILGYHATGYTNNLTGRPVPARDVVGVRPVGWEKITDALDDYVDEIFTLGGNY